MISATPPHTTCLPPLYILLPPHRPHEPTDRTVRETPERGPVPGIDHGIDGISRSIRMSIRQSVNPSIRRHPNPATQRGRQSINPYQSVNLRSSIQASIHENNKTCHQTNVARLAQPEGWPTALVSVGSTPGRAVMYMCVRCTIALLL